MLRSPVRLRSRGSNRVNVAESYIYLEVTRSHVLRPRTQRRERYLRIPDPTLRAIHSRTPRLQLRGPPDPGARATDSFPGRFYVKQYLRPSFFFFSFTNERERGNNVALLRRAR